MEGLLGEKPFVFEGKYSKELLLLIEGAKVLSTYEDNVDPSLVENHCGKGMAVLSTVPRGTSFFDKPGNPMNKLILGLVKESGVAADAKFVSPTHGFLNLRVHSLDDTFIVYAINSGRTEKCATLDVNVGGFNVKSVKDIISGKNYNFIQDGEVISMMITVPPDHAVVLLAD